MVVHLGDGAALASLTGIPEIFWVIIWSVLGVSVLYKLGKSNEKMSYSNCSLIVNFISL